MRRWLRVLAVLAVGALLAAVVLVYLPPERLKAMSEATGRWATGLAVTRIAAIGALWWWWEPLVERLGLSDEGREYLRSKRVFYCLMLCAIELFVVQNVIGRVWWWLT